MLSTDKYLDKPSSGLSHKILAIGSFVHIFPPQVAIEEEEKAALNEDRKVNYTEVLVTEVTDEGKFCACNVSDGTALEKLMDNLREEFTTNPPLSGACQPKKNDLCAARLVEDQWYRAKVEKIGVSEVQVLFGDLL